MLANEKAFAAPEGVCVLDAARAAGFVLEHSCRAGRCGACKARLLDGSVTAIRPDLYLSDSERASGWTLTCVNAANSDLRLDIEDLGHVANLAIKTLPCRIDAIERPAHDVVIVRLRMPPRTRFEFLAGQYVDLIGPGGIRRSYSIANPPDGSDRLELHIRRVEGGALSHYWFEEAKLNDLLRLRGPLGTFFLREVSGTHLVLLATGTGIAPISAMLGDLAYRPAGEQPETISLLWGNRDANDIYLPNDTFSGSAHTAAVRLTHVVSRPDIIWSGARGHVQNVLLEQSPELRDRTVYACGSPAMIDSSRALLIAANLPTKRFFADAFVASE